MAPAPRPGTVAARILALLQKASPLCDSCMTDRLRLTVEMHANNEANKLAKAGLVDRSKGRTCSACGSTRRLTSSATDGVPPATPEAKASAPSATPTLRGRKPKFLAPARGGVTREVGGYVFERVGDVTPARDHRGDIILKQPHLRYRGSESLLPGGTGPFCDFTVAGAPAAAGVYLLEVDGEVRYVGEAENLARRFYQYGHISPRNCFQGGRSTNVRLQRLLIAEFEKRSRVVLWFHATPHYKEVEADLLRRLDGDFWNRKGRRR